MDHTPQVEVLCRAKSAKRTKFLSVPEGVQMSFQYADKGSYRQEHMLRYLSRWLDPMTPAREAAGDYRIMYLDVAKSHLADPVVEASWDRGYIPLFHYGCTTGVAQVNDTHCHGDFERIYLELEQAAFTRQQMLDPGYIGRSLQQLVDDVAATWRALDPSQAVLGHKRVGLSNRLDGTEDWLITREARFFWDALGMKAVREEAVAEVDRLVLDGTLKSMADWRTLVQHPVDPGIVEDEGAEFEGELATGEKLWWEEGEEEKMLAADEADEHELDLVEVPAGGSVDVLEPGAVLPADPLAEVMVASVAARRLLSLKRLRAAARTAKIPRAVFHFDKEISYLERGLHMPSPAAKCVNTVLRRHVDLALQKELRETKENQEEALLQARNRRLVKMRMGKEKARKLEAAKAAAELKKVFDDLPKHFSTKACGAPGKKGAQLRSDCLERLKLRAPPLSLGDELLWPEVRDKWAAYLVTMYSSLGEQVVGHRFVMKVNRVLEDLGSHYGGPSPWAAKDPTLSDKAAFEKLFKEMQSQLPKATVGLTF